VGGFGVGVAGTNVFAGYLGGYWLRRVNWRGAHDNDHNGDDEGFPMDWVCLNGATRGRVVDKNVDGNGRGSPTDFASLNEARIDPLGRGRLAGRVYK
jgi:hypothetical protein